MVIWQSLENIFPDVRNRVFGLDLLSFPAKAFFGFFRATG